MNINHIYNGESLEVLKTLPDESIDMCITSPPYWALRDYGTASWEGGDKDCDHLKSKLASKKTGLNTGNYETSKVGTFGMPYKDKCGKCGAIRIDKQLGLEPTFTEYIDRLCDIFDEVKRVLKKEGTCWVNLGDTYNSSSTEVGRKDKDKYGGKSGTHCLRGGVKDLSAKCLLQIPSRFAIEMTNRGWILRNEIIWHKPNCMPSSVKDRFTVDFEKLFFFTKSKKYYFETQYEPYTEDIDRWGGTQKRSAINEKIDEHNKANANSLARVRDMRPNPEGKNKRTVWTINTKPYPEAHFAVFPEELIQTPIKAGSPKDGTVLDPFMGSGTTAKVAKDLDRNYVGIELNPEYIELAYKRIGKENKLI